MCTNAVEHNVRFFLDTSFQSVDSAVQPDSWYDLFIARRVSSSAPVRAQQMCNSEKDCQDVQQEARVRCTCDSTTAQAAASL